MTETGAKRYNYMLPPRYKGYVDAVAAFHGIGNQSEALRKIIDYHREQHPQIEALRERREGSPGG